MPDITLTAAPIYKKIEANLLETGNITLVLYTRAYAGYTPVDIVTIFPTLAPPEDWDGTLWDTDVAAEVETRYNAAGYLYPS